MIMMEEFRRRKNLEKYWNEMNDLQRSEAINKKSEGDNGIIIRESMYDQKNKKAKIVWTREYDLETERAIVIMSNMNYTVWLQWGVYNRLDNVIDAPRKT